jgi:hypothetical protein
VHFPKRLTDERQEDPMGLFKGAAKAGIAAKAIEIVRREAAKPQNRAKARELVAKLQDRGRGTRRPH